MSARVLPNEQHMDTLAPPKEQLEKFEYIPPERSQTRNQTAYRKLNGFERIKSLEPVHRQAVARLEKHYYGAQGVNVSVDEELFRDRTDVPDEFAQHRHAGLLENAKKAVGSPRTWKALTCQIESTLTPQDIGHQWGGIKGRQQAKGYGEGIIIAGLDTLCIHWGLVTP